VTEAKVARPDTLLLAAVVLAQGALARVWLRSDDGPDFLQAFLFWTGLGLGNRGKGAIAPVVVGLTIAVLAVERGGIGWLRRLAPLPGAIWLVFLLLPWLVAMMIAAGGDPIPERIRAETLAVQGALAAPPGTYLIVSLLTFWPASVFAIAALPFVLDHSRRKLVVFMLAWAVPFWIAAELFPPKLPQYILPAFPALAILAATAVDEGGARLKGWFAWLLSLSLFLVPLAMGGWLAVSLLDEDRGMAIAGLVLIVAAVAVAVLAWRWLSGGVSQIGAAALSVVAATFFHLAVFGFIVPSFDGLRLAENAISAGHAALPCADPEFAATGFREPSILLAGRSKVRLTDGAGAADFLAGGPCRGAIVEMRQQSIFNQRVEDLGLAVQLRKEIPGFNPGTLKQNSLRIITVEGDGG
jgi:4-amino-4-deoxy-L-arabinose transferase-like glycosyltransferase